MDIAIKTEGITKKHGAFRAVDDVSISVQRSEIYAFLGLNGAGKTTTIRMLLGMIRPTEGTAYVMGERVGPHSYEIWRHVGYMVETPYAYPDLTVRENIEIFRKLRGLEPQATNNIIQRLSLQSYSDRKAKHLSLGNAQRLGLAKALIHNPEILILDEPVNGLDPAGVVEVRELLKELAEKHGTTIFISSHLLGEVAKLAMRVGIIHQGKLLQEIDSHELEHLSRKRLAIDGRDRRALRKQLASMGLAASTSSKGWLEVDDAKAVERPEEINQSLVAAGMAPTYIAVVEEDLEQYFLRSVGLEHQTHDK